MLSTINITHAASEIFKATNGADPVALKEEMLAIITDQDGEFFSDIFANSSVAVAGSFDAGSYRYRVSQRPTTETTAQGDEVSTAAAKIREVIAIVNEERNTVATQYTNEELAMYDAVSFSSDMMNLHLTEARNDMETKSFGELETQAVAAAQIEYSFAPTDGQDVYDAITAHGTALVDGDATNTEKMRWSKGEIVYGMTNAIYQLLALVLTNNSTGSETQASMLLTGQVPNNIVGGFKVFIIPASVLPVGTSIIAGSNGKFGTLLKRRRLRTFIETPSLRQGNIYSYMTWRDMNKVVQSDALFVWSSATAPVLKSTKSTK